jgi:hypothetical protein
MSDTLVRVTVFMPAEVMTAIRTEHEAVQGLYSSLPHNLRVLLYPQPPHSLTCTYLNSRTLINSPIHYGDSY